MTQLFGKIKALIRACWRNRYKFFILFISLNILFSIKYHVLLANDLSDDMKFLADLANRASITRNKHIPLEANNIPLVIYVRSRAEYFSQVIEGFRGVTGIEKTVIVVSHDSVEESMYRLSESINFAQVLYYNFINLLF